MLATLHIAPLRLSAPKPRPQKRIHTEKHVTRESPSRSVRQSKRLRGLDPTGVKREEREQSINEDVEYYSPKKRTEHLTEESYANRMERCVDLGSARIMSSESASLFPGDVRFRVAEQYLHSRSAGHSISILV
jgi:hypothetical protein